VLTVNVLGSFAMGVLFVGLAAQRGLTLLSPS
jgi:fluoride ion exporter CrcB/FEX